MSSICLLIFWCCPRFIFTKLCSSLKNRKIWHNVWKPSKNVSFWIFAPKIDEIEFLMRKFKELKKGWTLFENHQKCRIWIYYSGISHQFLSPQIWRLVTLFDRTKLAIYGFFFWLTVVHSKCKRSSFRSQCWMRHSLWFSNTVWRRRSEVIFPLYFSYFSKDKRDDQNKEIKEAAKRKSVEFPSAFWEIKI